MNKLFRFILTGLIIAPYLIACTSEQVKRATYHAMHEKQRRECMDAGRQDCSQYDYDSYDKYQREKKGQ